MSPRTEEIARFIAELEAKPEFHIVSALVTQPDSSTEDAVQHILTLTTALLHDSKTLGNHLYDTACSVLEAAIRTPAAQQAKLVSFVSLLQKKTLTDPETGEPAKHDGDLIWAGLPTFGYTFGDELGSFNPLSPDISPAFRQRWENTTSFFAQLTAAFDPADFSTWALSAFSYAFGPWDTPRRTTDVAVRAACLWYVYAADRLWAHVVDVKDEDYSREDWDRYKRSLVDAQATFATDEETTALIADALKQIERVEAKV